MSEFDEGLWKVHTIAGSVHSSLKASFVGSTAVVLYFGSMTSAVRRHRDPTSSKKAHGQRKKQTLNPARKRTARAAHEAAEGGLSLPSMLRRWVVEAVRTDGVAAAGVVVARADRENLFVDRNQKRERRKQQRRHTHKNNSNIVHRLPATERLCTTVEHGG